jgi:nucleotide-binding universal stress UspA family protein
MTRAMLGSVTSAVLSSTSYPVLVVVGEDRVSGRADTPAPA